jgi:hypothetical protein
MVAGPTTHPGPETLRVFGAGRLARALKSPGIEPETRMGVDLEARLDARVSRAVLGVSSGKGCRLCACFTCDTVADAEDLEQQCAAAFRRGAPGIGYR